MDSLKSLKYISVSSTVFVITLFLLVQEVFGNAEYQKEAQRLHNKYRQRHNSDRIHMSNELNKDAMKCAQYYVEKGVIDHSCPYAQTAGENIWAQWGGDPSPHRVATHSVNSWYSEEAKYKYRDRQKGTGHFTQLVWKESREMGFGMARKGKMAAAVALYYPPGNFKGEYEENVERPSS